MGGGAPTPTLSQGEREEELSQRERRKDCPREEGKNDIIPES
jgi:hypothetical protein